MLREFKLRSSTLHVFVILLNINSNRVIYINDGVIHV